MKLTLHIGTTKSGTTSLQKALLQCAPRLSKVGVYYDHHTLNQNGLELLVRDQGRWTREFRSMDPHVRALERKEAARIVERLKKATADRRYAEAIVSSEYLSLFDSQEVTRFLDLLDLPEVEIQVACYLRRPSRHWLSLGQQLLKASSTFPAAADYRYDLREKLEAWQSDPRIRRMIVRPSDGGQLVGGSVVSDFVAHVVPSAALIRDVDTRSNESLSAEAAILQQRFRKSTHPGSDNQFTEVGARVMDAILAVSVQVPGTQLQARQELLDLVDKQHLNSLRWLESRYGVQLVPSDEVGQLEALDIDGDLGRETCVEEICTAFDQDVLERLTAGVMLHLAGDREGSVAPSGRLARLGPLGTRLARLGSPLKRRIAGR